MMETQQIVALLVAQRNRLDAPIHSLEDPVKRHGGPLAILNGRAKAAAFILFPAVAKWALLSVILDNCGKKLSAERSAAGGPDNMWQDSMIDKVLGHYRIVSKFGEGGMGVVYRARDQVLQRDVALKLLGETLAREARQLLLREARAVSALSHPNICTVHEVGEADGEFYIVMELIEGKPLSASIGSGGLPYESVMRYGAQIAGALTHAHGRNIVHRDLKSSNVIVTPVGLVKVLDFGLAQRLATEGQDEGTRTMDTLESVITTGGTLSYMSPYPRTFRPAPLYEPTTSPCGTPLTAQYSTVMKRLCKGSFS